jgi:hypothetical protein
MRTSPALATFLVCTIVAASAPSIARADEEHADVVEAPAVVPLGVPRIFLTPAETIALAPSLPSIGPSTNGLREIRLSSEAKTWIIVGAIVGGILLIAGVIVLAKPFKKV